MENRRIEVGITSTGKYENLGILLWSLRNQTMSDWDLTIVDDSLEGKDMRLIPGISDVLKLINSEGHNWRVLFGPKKGWHHAQQIILNNSRNLLTMTLDEDQALESNVLLELSRPFEDDGVGATGSLFYLAGDKFRSLLPWDWEKREDYHGRITFNEKGVGYGSQLQLSTHQTVGPKEADHLMGGCIMYRTDLGRQWGFDLDFNYTAFCSDDLFSYKFYSSGYKVLVVPAAVVWHFPTNKYGSMEKGTEEFLKLRDENRKRFEEIIRSMAT